MSVNVVRMDAIDENVLGRPWYFELIWAPAAGLLGFLITAVFAGVLHLSRALFLVPYLSMGGLFVYGFFRWSRINLRELFLHHFKWGILAAPLCGVFQVMNVLSQPVSPRAVGLDLAADLLWSGVLYGLLDALLLSVLPVLAVWRAISALGWTASWPGKIGVGLLALLASLFVTLAYHAGYPEYRGPSLGQPAIGNGILSLAYLLSNNPLSAVLAHIAMHVAGVLQGPANIVQLPPHY